MLQNKTASVPETIVRFFSFFTILTNILVAVYLSMASLQMNTIKKRGILTAVTVYITVVGLVYQVVLREIWKPTGLQMIVNELLHSVIPLLMIFFWYLYEDKNSVRYKQIPEWLIYPLTYLIFILTRGYFSNFYPYPFVNVTEIGISQTLINSVVLVGFFIILSVAFIFLGKKIAKKKSRVVDINY